MNSSFFNTQICETEDDHLSNKSGGPQTSKEEKIQRGRKQHDQIDEALWSIDDDILFYPLGLTNHCTENKNRRALN